MDAGTGPPVPTCGLCPVLDEPEQRDPEPDFPAYRKALASRKRAHRGMFDLFPPGSATSRPLAGCSRLDIIPDFGPRRSRPPAPEGNRAHRPYGARCARFNEIERTGRTVPVVRGSTIESSTHETP